MNDAEAIASFADPGSAFSPSQGADIASATTIAPVAKIHRVTGTVAIVTITVPYTGFKGSIFLIPTGAFTWTTAGNIGLLGTAVVGRVLQFVYHPDQGKWYPSYV